MRDNELIDYNGKLAIHAFTFAERNEPQYRTTLYVSNIKAADWTHLLGCVPSFPSGLGYPGFVHPVGVYTDTVIDLKDWITEFTFKPIAKPRDGKEYTWEYSDYKWRKSYFPRCSACREYHNPAFQLCPFCDRCHRIGSKCK